MSRSLLSIALLLTLAACSGESAPTAPAEPPPPAPAEPAPPAPAEAYPVCDRAPPADGVAPARTGDPGRQLAPVRSDQMVDCQDADEAPPEAAAIADAGALNERGDCVWASGPSCHFHSGVEFTDPNAPAAEGVRELHCIFPGAPDANSPEVYGGHFVCKAGTATTPEKGAAGAACGAGLLPALRASLLAADEAVRCCDDGTLTATYEAQTPEQRQLRPDFHVAPKAMELDCGALAGLEAHSAFGAAESHEAH